MPIDTSLDSSFYSPTPCTVFAANAWPQDESSFDTLLAQFSSVDDVWSPIFGSCIIVQTTDQNLALSDLGETAILGRDIVHIRHVSSLQESLPKGPYFLLAGLFHEAWRLYPDTSAAFMVAAVPDDQQRALTGDPYIFKSSSSAAYGATHPTALTIAVPSRLYFSKTAEKPYNGLRIAVKDLLHISGLTTTASSRAFAELHGPRNETAAVVRRLVDMGCVIVGKTVLTQFANSEWPTRDYIDYHGPFNPRGDGSLTPSGSSSGSASAVSSYDWLDFAIGTDSE